MTYTCIYPLRHQKIRYSFECALAFEVKATQ